MIKSALSNEPLLNTDERVRRAIRQVTQNKNFSENEKMWLDLIANHLEYNLLIERKHFDTIPFSGKGGWKKANEDFKNNLQNIMERINVGMAS